MKRSIYGPEDFLRDTSVSRETLARLQAYAGLLETWNKTTNLVGPSSIGDLWFRHMLDSAQLLPFVQDTPSLLDLGSGAGFPGLVLAVLGQPHVHLVESDQRKAAFLREAARMSQTKVTIHAVRVEALRSVPTAQITARALASVEDLLSLTENLTTPETKFVLLKGQNVGSELTEAHKMWTMTAQTHVSRTDSLARVVILREVSRVPSGSAPPP